MRWRKCCIGHGADPIVETGPICVSSCFEKFSVKIAEEEKKKNECTLAEVRAVFSFSPHR